MKIQVQCYSGQKGDEKPIRFQLGGHDLEVVELNDQWYGPDSSFFKVTADDGNLYILRHRQADDEWTLESFRRQQ